MPSWTAVSRSSARNKKRRTKDVMGDLIIERANSWKTQRLRKYGKRQHDDKRQKGSPLPMVRSIFQASLPFHFLTDERKLFLAFLLGGVSFLSFFAIACSDPQIFIIVPRQTGDCKESIKLRHDPADHAGLVICLDQVEGKDQAGEHDGDKWSTTIRMFRDGPEVSLNGSPTVSPTTAA